MPDLVAFDAKDCSLQDLRATNFRLLVGAIALLIVCAGLVWQGLMGDAGNYASLLSFLGVSALAAVLVIGDRKARKIVLQRRATLKALLNANVLLRLAQTANEIAIVDWDCANDHAVWSLNFVDVFGIPSATPPTKTPYALFIELVHPDDRSRIDAMHHRILKTGGTFSEEFRILTLTGAIRWIAIRGEVFCDEYGTPQRFIGSNFDITERRQNEDQLKQSLAIIELANDAGEIGVWNFDSRTGRGTWDERTRNILGLAAAKENVNLTHFKNAIHEDDRARTRSVILAALKTGEKFLVEARVYRPDRSIRWVRIRGMAEIDPISRRAMTMTGIMFDITERRQHETHLRFLMRELTHRSKNLLAVIQAMARQTGGDSTSLDEFQARFSARLQGLAASHDLLVNEDWQGADIADIVRSQVGHFTDQIGDRFHLSGPSVQLKPEAAQNVGLALHELSTNAAKYGALANATGKVDVSWRVEGTPLVDRRLVMVWHEMGGPLVTPPTRRGFGSIVTERIVARALEGKVTMAFDPDGVTWTLEIPAAYMLADAGPLPLK
ncbi:MAG: PAS domain-containing protein [Hyphomicrobiales bacterium]|nr:PAS domain-containing protein [Hyphomicrobiales bacterium]MDE2115959.1 PAS domain-containing protein [Hyphomicrobiales bacterium]